MPHEVERYRRQAREMRARAFHSTDSGVKSRYLELAAESELLAERRADRLIRAGVLAVRKPQA